MRKVGNFGVCEVCNNIADIMRDGRRNWTQAQREVLKMYRIVHLNQQSAERKVLERTKQLCSELETQTGQPKALFFFVDGMTESRGDIPRLVAENGRESKGDKNAKHVTNRVLGCEVICGPLNKYIFYITDNMTGGGSNTMIEVIRQLLYDTEDILSRMNLKRPRTMYLQFDNW
jgi:HPt (histidine-containing phosphotransfer) domain-containing protein